MHLECLPDAKVQHDLLAATWDSVSADITIQTLNLATLATTAVRQTTEDLTGLAGAVLEGNGTLGLQTGNGATKLEHSLGLVHALALEDYVLEPCVRSLDLAGHVCELETDDGMLDEGHAKGAALVGIGDTLGVTDTREADALDDDANTLVVEVGHDDLETLVLLADQVLNGDLDVLKGDVGGSRGPDTLAVHAARGDAASLALNEQHAESVHAGLAGADGDGEVVRPDTVSDPLLLAIDDVVLAVLGELGLAAQARNVGSCVRLRDGEADTLVTVEDAGENALFQGV